MRVLASIGYSKGISEPLLQSLADSRLVHEVFVVSDREMLQIPGIRWYRTPAWLKSPVYKVTVRGILRVITHFMLMLYLTIRNKPDIIAGFHIFPQCVYAFICAKLFRKPVIACIGDWPGIWRGRRRLLPMLRNCSLVTTTGSRTREYLIKQGISQDKVWSRPDPTDTERYRPIPLPKIYDVLFLGRLDTEKNVDTLLRAVDYVRRVKADLRVCIVGDGYLRESLEQLTAQLRITDYVKFQGWEENPEYYCNSSRILVLTSLHEGLPRVMIEAMACSVPCVVPNVGDITDAAIDGFNAIVIQDPKDIQGFADALIRLLNNDDLYQRLSQNTRHIVEERYSLGSCTQVWDRILEQLDQRAK